MRVSSVGLAMLAAAITSVAVFGGLQKAIGQEAFSPSPYPVSQAQAFGATSKMQGPARGPTVGNAPRATNVAPRFNPQAGMPNPNAMPQANESVAPEIDTTLPPSVGQSNVIRGPMPTTARREYATPERVQEVFPATQPRTAPPQAAQPSVPASQTSPATSSGNRNSLQQRLAAMRQAGEKETAGGNTPVMAAGQQPTPAVPPGSDAGPNDGPVPPGMPSIRTAARPAPAVTVPSVVPTVVSPGDEQEPAPTAVTDRPSSPTAPSGVSSRRQPTVSAPVVGGTIEPNAATNIATPATAKPNNVLFSRQSPLLSVETTGPRSINIGKEAAYVISISNAGEVAAQDVVVSIKIPAWTEVAGTKPTNGHARHNADDAAEPLVWNLSRLEARGKEQLTLKLIPRESKPFDLAVQWTFLPAASQTLVEVKEPKLSMSLEGPNEVLFGDTKVYKLAIGNPGTGDCENTMLHLSPVDGGAGAPTKHEIGAIRAGESKIIEVELTARQSGTLNIKAVAVADGSLRAEVAEEVLVRRAGLKLAASAPELKFAGTLAGYTISVTNPGNATAESVNVAAILPTGAKYVSSSGGQHVAEQNKVTWTVPPLRPGAEHQLELRCTLHTPGDNKLQVVSTAASDLSDSVAALTSVEALADLKLDVTDPSGPMAVGDEVIYEVRIRNRGTKAAESVDVAGFFSGGIEPVGAAGSQHELASGQVLFKPIGSIAPGAEVVLKIKAKAQQAGNHVFRAEVNCVAVGTKLAAEETTLFYGDSGSGPTRTATRPESPLTPVPAGESPTPAVPR